MTATKKVPLDETKRRLIADAENPDAWEPLGSVSPSNSPRPTWYGQQSGIAPRWPSSDPPYAQQFKAAYQPPTDHASREVEALRRKQLHDAIAALPQGQRQVIQLWLDGFPYSDIAHTLDVTVEAVRSRLREAKRHLHPKVAAADMSSTMRNDDRTSGE